VQKNRKLKLRSNNNNNNNNNNNSKIEPYTINTTHVETKIIPVIIGASGPISKSFRKHLSNIPEKHEIKELQKTAILGTAHKFWKILL
jgi:hypothetical protein